MFGFGYKYIFKSRWGALAFAAFVCWSAAQYAAPDETVKTPKTANAWASEDATMAQMVHSGQVLQNIETEVP